MPTLCSQELLTADRMLEGTAMSIPQFQPSSDHESIGGEGQKGEGQEGSCGNLQSRLKRV